jgi:hypothetical protein
VRRSNHFWARHPWEAGEEYVELTYSGVAAEQRVQAHDDLMTVVVPNLAQYLRRAAQAPEGWRILRHARTWTWRDGVITSAGDHYPEAA